MSNFFSEILQSLKKTSTERISNPFYGVLIFSWITLNWESVSILIFSDLKMQDRVSLINSEYPIKIFWPFIIAVILTFLLPWCTEKVTFFQSKPISRTSTLLAIRRKRMLLADISVERFRAKRDVTYERHKVGAEKEVQEMREAIVLSKETTGQLTDELNKAVQKISELSVELDNSKAQHSLQTKKIEELNKENIASDTEKKSLLEQLDQKEILLNLIESDKDSFVNQLREYRTQLDSASLRIAEDKKTHEIEIQSYIRILSMFDNIRIKEVLDRLKLTQEEHINILSNIRNHRRKKYYSK
ncbi:hypothetical protein [Pantoea ananatis]|uniref:hypothetical protein n=1 Tax=Pantoea ananas TaxID=553 RepID=UPI0023505211|nr:hypothetical protein [Pantoea ananatis]